MFLTARRSAGVLALGILCLWGVACAGVPRPGTVANAAVVTSIRTRVIPPAGILYSSFKAPVTLDFPGNRALGSKKGTSTVRMIGLPPLPFPGLYTGLHLVSWGDASVKQAAANGRISDVEHVDYDFSLVLMIYRRFTVEVYGE